MNPKDVPIQKIETCDVFDSNTDKQIFRGLDIEFKQERPEQIKTIFGNMSVSGRSGVQETLIIMVGNRYVLTEVLTDLYFIIKIKRLDVIEILKYGQYISIKGKGSGIEVEDLKETQNTKLTILVKGQLDIK